MSVILTYKIWIITAVFLTLLGLGKFRPAVNNSYYTFKRWLKNIGFWPINTIVSLIFILPLTYYATEHHLWTRPETFNMSWLILIDILIIDCFMYWWHRTVHEVPFFWRFHQVHHLDKTLDVTSAVRFHFGEIVFATLFRCILILIFSIPFSAVLIFEVILMVCNLFHHSNVKLNPTVEKYLSKIIVTPSIHWVHHHAIQKDTDSNYASFFSFWDILFKTHSQTIRTPSMKIGIIGEAKDYSFWQLLLLPFKK